MNWRRACMMRTAAGNMQQANRACMLEVGRNAGGDGRWQCNHTGHMAQPSCNLPCAWALAGYQHKRRLYLLAQLRLARRLRLVPPLPVALAAALSAPLPAAGAARAMRRPSRRLPRRYNMCCERSLDGGTSDARLCVLLHRVHQMPVQSGCSVRRVPR